MTTRKILVTGATGKQGGALVKALLANPPPFDYEILALTRKTTSNAAKALASKPQVTLIEGDLDDCTSIFTKAGGIGAVWGVFCVTMPNLKQKVEGKEVQQGIDMVDAAVAHKVKHFVYTSVDRGGPDKSEVDATYVAHFVSKYNVEKHLKEKTRGTEMTYTILRPTAFMDNLKPNLFGRLFAANWHSMGDKPLQLVAVRDIGIFAAKAFGAAETEDYKNTAISLAGCDLTQAEANEIFWKVLGRPMPRAYDFVSSFFMYMVPELGNMIRWFKEQGYGADLAQCRRLNPQMMDFEVYLREESGFKR
ncbi:uncharacterized protein Z520_02185 [Fonsecaea multimorphosa CBS 102226]|uniref:NmrA-like domain-containing protein n=1 Tax=Fonsecaea multimorphosa CBS 102226 TaxID=1442371 RepID=A0A0D2IYB7_9EURO|nr:uncharacterized protein Z520_02185 [Fonsecaea multimorphosa CBS 102226]KIY02047.1 hypothetical protein Z520_02185 [Fonsecaea multimorphosa CBS 102226]OAL29247.1 hypothetical protein AYO22_02141 [Fonsecaea multimorphosa]